MKKLRVGRLPLLILTPYIGTSFFFRARCNPHEKLAPESGVYR